MKKYAQDRHGTLKGDPEERHPTTKKRVPICLTPYAGLLIDPKVEGRNRQTLRKHNR